MPRIFWKFVERAAGRVPKLLVASHIATSVSQGRGVVLSSSELSDLWNLKNAGIGGVVLTEETAVNPNFLPSIRLTKALIES